MQAAGDEVPVDEIAPELPVACLPFWEAFWTLHRGRGWIVGPTRIIPQPLVLTEILAWAKATQEDAMLMVTLVQLLDGRWWADYMKR